MNKLWLGLLILGVGAVTFAALNRITAQADARHAEHATTLMMVTNRLAELLVERGRVRHELLESKNQRRQAAAHPQVRPDLLAALEGQTSGLPAEAWVELREQFAVGWHNSADYVLVHKRVLKSIGLETLSGSGDLTERAAAVLAITEKERERIFGAIEQVKDEQARNVVRAEVVRREPEGDILAHYVINPRESAVEHSISNNFFAKITEVLGSERAEIFGEDAWRKLQSQGPAIGQSPVTMTIRRSNANGDAGLICELREGASVRTSQVRYGNYPSAWFLTLFPDGWESLAEREGFALPANFKSQR